MDLDNSEITSISYYSDYFKILTPHESKIIKYKSITNVQNNIIEKDSNPGALSTLLGSMVGIATGDITGLIGGGVGGWLISKFIPNKKIKYLTVTINDDEYISFISEKAEKYQHEIKENFNEHLFNSIKEIKNNTDIINQKLEILKKEKEKFISHSEIYKDKIAEQALTLIHYDVNSRILSIKNSDLLKEIKNNSSYIENERKKHNKEYINKNLDNHYLSKLTSSQKKAILIDEDSTLINAGAGSGKTTTLIGKILFLLDKKLCKPEELLVLAYNNAVRKELINKIKKIAKRVKLKDLDQLDENNIHTFHSYGLKFLKGKDVSKVLSQASSFEDEITIKRSEEIDIMINILSEEYDFKEKLLNFLSQFSISYTDYFEDISTFSDYVKHIRNITQRSLKGDFMRSFEEIEIANYLYLNGINYEYEFKYKGLYENDQSFTLNDLKVKNLQTNKDKAKNYHPDFYLTDYDIYIEHFALDENNDAPPYFKDPEGYYEQYEEKIEVHKNNETKLIETFSWMKRQGILTTELHKALKSHKVKFNPLSDNEKIKKFNDSKYVSNFNNLIAQFLRHVKLNELNFDDIKKKVFTINQPINQNRAALFIEIFERVYNLYESNLKEQNAVDYEDMITLSRKKIINENYKYILVDEFQDISKARARLLKKIKEENNSKLYCVGDDWQAIYGFIGGDINIFTKNFSKYFGFFESQAIDVTFRYGENINKVTSTFIKKNPDQLGKKVESLVEDKGEIYIYDKINFEEVISKYANTKSKIYILGRQNIQNYKTFEQGNAITKKRINNITNKFKNIEYKTIHSAKGLEADHIFIINLFVGIDGFPTQKINDEILKIVHSSNDLISEERRLMYVAMTRARKTVHLFSGSEWACSDFVKEIARDYPTNIKSFLKKTTRV